MVAPGKLEPGGKELLFSHASGWAEPSKPENFELYSDVTRTDTCRVSRTEVLWEVPVRRSPKISSWGAPGTPCPISLHVFRWNYLLGTGGPR